MAAAAELVAESPATKLLDPIGELICRCIHSDAFGNTRDDFAAALAPSDSLGFAIDGQLWLCGRPAIALIHGTCTNCPEICLDYCPTCQMCIDNWVPK